ncbi:MAG: beta-ketoacyl synthase N-terminal-like domain-containing protein, partial [Candidatus Brocadiales bacterium]
MEKRVVVTGMGIISPVGVGKESFWENLQNGVSGIKPV